MLENPYDAVSDGLKQTVFTPASTLVDAHEKSLHTYLLLNAAASPDIAICLAGFSPAYRSLFDVSVLDNLGHVAPYLVQINAHSDVLWTGGWRTAICGNGASLCAVRCH